MIDNWNASLFDAQGGRWYFAYKGGSFVRIRPWGTGDWTNTIQLDNYGLKPDTVTKQWLTARADEWITDYNADVAAGNIT